MMLWWLLPYHRGQQFSGFSLALVIADVIAGAGLPHHGSNPARAALGDGFSSCMYQSAMFNCQFFDDESPSNTCGGTLLAAQDA